MTLESMVFIFVFLLANGYFAYRMSILIKLAKSLHGKPWSGNRLDNIPKRISTFFLNVLGQKAVLRKPAAGLMHAFIFWGFLIITVGTLEMFVTEIFPTATFEFIGQTPYGLLMFLQDSFSLIVFLSICAAFYRRLILKPEGIGQSSDAVIILSLISLLMLSLMGMNAFRMIGQPQWYDGWMWFSSLLARGLEVFAMNPDVAAGISSLFRWIHLLIVLGFLMYIPSSKHLHVLAAGPNTFLRKLSIEKGMKPLVLDDENATTFGATKISDLSWKDAVDGYACTECGRCQDACPAWNTGKPLSPKKLILWLKDQMYENAPALMSQQYDQVKPILDERITDDFIWACTSCRACEAACPVFIEQTDKIYDIRRSMVLMESRFPAELNTVFKNVETNFSPWAMSPEDRGAWAQGLEVKTMAQIHQAEKPEAVEYLFWVGCAGSFDDRSKKVSVALVNLMKKAGLSFAILGSEEKCTGDPVRRMGNEYLAQTFIKENVDTLNRYQVKKVVTACPHCFNAIKNEWKDFGGNYEVIHHSQLLADLVQRGALKPKAQNQVPQNVTYHDSCYLTRWNGEVNAARTVLNSVESVNIIEMSKSGTQGMCCGAGGGRMWMEETIGKRVNIARTEQALETGAPVIAANCPFCITMLTDGIKAKEKTDTVVVKDIAEILVDTV